MVGMDDRRDLGAPSGEAPQQTGLRNVRVDDVVVAVSNEARQFEEGAGI